MQPFSNKHERIDFYLKRRQKRDSYRSACYRSEWEVHDKFDNFSSNDEIAEFISFITATQWWRLNALIPNQHVRVLFNSARSKSASAFADYNELRFPANAEWSKSVLVVIHELAHLCISKDLPAHGLEFCTKLVEMIALFYNENKARALQISYQQQGIKVQYFKALTVKPYRTINTQRRKQNPTIKTTRVGTGVYQYKGYTILKTQSAFSSYAHWRIKDKDNNDMGRMFGSKTAACNWLAEKGI